MLSDIFCALLLGILEGVTEWLPVSSTGHLILLEGVLFLPWDPAFTALFRVVIQLGAIMAVVFLYWARLCPFGRGREARIKALSLWGRVLLAALPAAVIGLFLDDLLDAHLYRPLVVGGMLILYGVLFLLVEKVKKPTPFWGISEEIPVKSAFFTGCFQVLSLIPGTSRSGATVLGGMLVGLSRPVAAEFSFFLGIPTMLGAGALKGVKFFAEGGTLAVSEWTALAVGTLTAFLTSLVVIRFLTDFVRRHSFAPFGIYRILLGGGVLLSILL